MSTPEIDPVTAESMEEDEEHTEPTLGDQDPGENPESIEDRNEDSSGMPLA
ncbi:hypothetical protein [Amycolatopsis coloradensis]|uniref:hypothetical protein n=1 Tax=Amycolatopsis coloradensis TaxID=76021 RepID=UPI0013012AD9|nr:hypothetical protein [Amycolatopsis coloradensis]